MKLVEFTRNKRIVLQENNETIVFNRVKSERYSSVQRHAKIAVTYEDGTYIFLTVTFLSDLGATNVCRYVFKAGTFEFVAEHDGSQYWSVCAPNGYEYLWCADKVYLARYKCLFFKGILFINENDKVIVSTCKSGHYHFVNLGTIDKTFDLLYKVEQEAF